MDQKQNPSEGEDAQDKKNPDRDTKTSKGSEGRDMKPEERSRKEAMSILRRLEGNEEQAFRNNERLEEMGGSSSEKSW